jgi:hypothetical protein
MIGNVRRGCGRSARDRRRDSQAVVGLLRWPALSRLDNIIARNNKRPSEKTLVTLVLSGIVLVLLVLAVFTDLGRPPVPVRAPGEAVGSGSAGAGAGHAVVGEPPRGPVRHVHGVLLRAPSSSRPAQPAR